MVKARINGKTCLLFYDERIPLGEAPLNYPYMYHLRHDEDDWTCPINIEKNVLVNFFGTIFAREPVELGEDDYLEIEQFEIDWDYFKFRLPRSLIDQHFGFLRGG